MSFTLYSVINICLCLYSFRNIISQEFFRYQHTHQTRSPIASATYANFLLLPVMLFRGNVHATGDEEQFAMMGLLVA